MIVRAMLKRDQKRFSKIYRPLACLFTTRHIEVCSGIGAPTFRHRWRNALVELIAYRKPLVGLKRAVSALGDRRSTTSAALSLGGNFPMTSNIKRVHANAQYAHDELLNLIRRADHSSYEARGDGLLTEEQLALFLHIVAEHTALATRLA
ncbi:hypothetical protein BHK69_30030 (plasmid) [Bosea vaviloviae]|uniref:Uncharacterized protein n=2 Tax=Bosea vaviloviae TaxID=1526658 RepID=A0A1D7UC62_9HYPH|nr:hypothetical protein BHK69_30030 [Bosea vaviloviae]